MAKIIIEFDTITKAYSIRKDGIDMPDITSVSLYTKYDNRDEASIDITQVTQDEANDTTTIQTTIASLGKKLMQVNVNNRGR